jgi:hypothetical protein
MSGNAGKGRARGSRNKLTLETLELVADGKTPVAFALGIMNDATKGIELRLNAARIAAPYLHSKPQPEGRMVSLTLPEEIETPAALTKIHADILRAVATGEISLDEGRDVSMLLDSQRRAIETAELEERISKLERAQIK